MKIGFYVSLPVFLVLAITVASAQKGIADAVPQAPSPTTPFFNISNDLLLASSAVSLALDGVSTQRLFSFTYGGKPFNDEANPILRLSPSRLWTGVYFASAFAGEAGGMYYLHRRAVRPHSRRIWRIAEIALPVAVTAMEITVFAGNIRAIHHAECVSRYATAGLSTGPNPCP